MGADEMRGEINNRGRGGSEGLSWLTVIINREVPTDATTAGSLISAIYTSVRFVQVPRNQALQNYPPDTFSAHLT